MQFPSEEDFREWLKKLGENPYRDGLKGTYERFLKSREELFSGYHQDPLKMVTLFDSEGYDEMIISRDNDFFSTCEHHLLPFYGQAYVGYIPGKQIVGLSKFPRVIDIFARRLQNQERLTMQIAEFFWNTLKPIGLGVILEAEHLCIKARGAEKQNSCVITSAFRGSFKKTPETRAEFLNLIAKP